MAVVGDSGGGVSSISGAAWLQRILLGLGRDLGGLDRLTADASLGWRCIIQDGRVLAILSSDIVSSRDFWCPLGEDISGNRVQNLSQASTATHQIRCTRGHTSDAGHMHARIEMDV